jgi:hypothetical protein
MLWVFQMAQILDASLWARLTVLTRPKAAGETETTDFYHISTGLEQFSLSAHFHLLMPMVSQFHGLQIPLHQQPTSFTPF